MRRRSAAYDGRVTWDVWLDKCDKLAAMYADGRMTDDFAYDWRRAYEWGEEPPRAVIAAILREGVQDDDGMVW